MSDFSFLWEQQVNEGGNQIQGIMYKQIGGYAPNSL